MQLTTKHIGDVNKVIKASGYPNKVGTKQDAMYGRIFVLYNHGNKGKSIIAGSPNLNDLLIKTGLGHLFSLSY